MLRLFGAALLLSAAYLAGRGYARERQARLDEYEGFLAFLEDLRREVAESLRPLAAFCPEIRDARLAPCGFLSALHTYADPAAAFRAADGKLRLAPAAREVLRRCFDGFGEHYREEEIRRIDAYLTAFSSLTERERQEAPRSARLARGLLLSGAIAAVILLL